MSQKFEADLDIVAQSDIQIQIDPLTKDLDIIQKLDDEPNDVGGLSAQELKATFDRAGNLIKEYINETLIPTVLGDGLTEQNRQANEEVRQANEEVRQENEAARQEAEIQRAQTAQQLNKDLTDSVDQLKAGVEAAEAARNVWENYDPEKTYVPGNKVYYLGSSYVNKAPCTDVLPTVASNWQMVAKKGADSDEGMSQDEADLRYLQLTGGVMTGQMRVLAPEYDESPVPKWHVRPESIAVERLPDRTTYRVGDPVQAEGMVVTAKYKDGNSLRVTGYVCDPAFVQEDTGQITVVFGQPHAAPLSAELPFLPTSEMTNYSPATLPISQTWAAPVFMDGVWVMWNAAQTNSKWTAYSEDGGKTWYGAELPVTQSWSPPVYGGGVLVIFPLSSSETGAYSEDGGKTWKSALVGAVQSWMIPVYCDGVWFALPKSTSNVATYSEDGGKTWSPTILPLTQAWNPPVYSGGVLFLSPVSSDTALYSEDKGKTWKSASLPVAQNWGTPVSADGVLVMTAPVDTASSTAAYSEDGGKTWKSTALPVSQKWNPPVYCGGVWVLIPYRVAASTAVYSEDGGKTWKSATLPVSQQWNPPVYAGAAWVLCPIGVSSTAAYSEDGGRTWKRTSLPVSQSWNPPVYGDGALVLSPNSSASTAAYSEDGGKTWKSAVLPGIIAWKPPVCGGGVWVLIPYNIGSIAAYSADGGKTWKRVDLPAWQKDNWGSPAYGDGTWVVNLNVDTNIAAYASILRTLAPLPGETPAPVSAPPPSLEDRINALSAENAALAAAVERGLSL